MQAAQEPTIEVQVANEEPPPSSGRAAEATAPRAEQRPGPDHPRWNDWLWQMQNRIRSVEQLLARFPGLRDPDMLGRVAGKYPLAITPYYASLVRRADVSDPIFRMAVPQMEELFDPPFLHPDPLAEEEHMATTGLVHRYPDRALLLATTTCAMYCRHCTRKRVAGTKEWQLGPAALVRATDYLRAHPEIRDVVVSGGDPLTMSTEALNRILSAVRSVPSVDIIRIGTRAPVTMPQRVTAELADMLRQYHPLWINTHFNHPSEITPESAAACARLADAGLPVGNQSVLLRGVNDRPETMEQLCRSLVRIRVRPYYLFQCDLVRGVEHLRTPISRGLEIMEYLRGRLSGLAIPLYVVDTPCGGGKIPLLPNYIVSVSPTHTVLRNFEGMLVNYPEPDARTDRTGGELPRGGAQTVSDLARGRGACIVPARSRRAAARAARAASADPQMRLFSDGE